MSTDGGGDVIKEAQAILRLEAELEQKQQEVKEVVRALKLLKDCLEAGVKDGGISFKRMSLLERCYNGVIRTLRGEHIDEVALEDYK